MKPPARVQGLSDEAADWVEAFRADADQPVDVDAAWARFEEVVTPQPRRSARRWAVVAVLAAALALAWFAMPTHETAVKLEGAGQQARDEAVPPGAGRRLEGAAEPTPLAPAPAIETPASLAPTLDEVGAATPRRRPSADPVADEPESPLEAPLPGPSTLEEELRLLEAMRASSKAGRHAEALEHVRVHAQRFGSGPFAAERELTRVRALCGLGRLDAVREAKASFAEAFPSSHLGSLVRGTCESPRARTKGEPKAHE